MDTQTDTNYTSEPSTLLNDNDECKLGFTEQCKVVWEGLKKGFKTDGCTASPDLDFGICCKEHDMHYAMHDISKWEADKKLHDCMRKKGYVVLPLIYWSFVTCFGWFFWRKGKKK